MIDPHLQAVLDAMVQAGFALPDPLEAGALRAFLDVPIPGPDVEIAERRDLTIDSEGRKLPARLYHPQPGAILPLAMFFHGGGWVHGTLVICPLLSGPISILGMATKEEWNGKEAQAGRYHWQVA